MKRRSKAWLIYDILAGIVVIVLAFYGLQYILTRVIGAYKDFTLLLMIPLIILLTPSIVLGYHIVFKRYYSNRHTDENKKTSSKTSFVKMLIKVMIIMGIAVISLVYAVIYIYHENNLVLGSCFACIGILASLMHLPTTKQIVERILNRFMSSSSAGSRSRF